MSDREIEIQYDEESVDQSDPHHEEGVEVPYDRLAPDTLRNVICEFVTREWEEHGFYSYTLEEKIDQVMEQLRSGTAKLMFDPATNTCNIIPNK